MGKLLIELHDVCKSFGGKVLFDNFNLTIDTGESGFGKTVLMVTHDETLIQANTRLIKL